MTKFQDLLSYDPHTGVLTWRVRRGPVKAGSRAGTIKRDGYRRVQINGREWAETHVIWELMTGALPEKEIDHVNLDKADNRWANLRLANKAQQQANTRPSSRNRHGCKGLKWRNDRKKWRVEIYVNKKAVTVGHFTRKEDAMAAYEQAAKKHYGEFARVS